MRKLPLASGVVGLALVGTVMASPAFASSTANGNVWHAPITATGHNVQTDVGSCNNDWATVTLTKKYTLTTKAGGYNLGVQESGSLSTLAGVSPGACQNGPTPNGNTVTAGVSGVTQQTFNTTVTATTKPNRHPNCKANNGCATSSDFLNAVFGLGNSTKGTWSWTADYATKHHGAYFDTSTNWPLNNAGDITH
jgi:hypothetical protein